MEGRCINKDNGSAPPRTGKASGVAADAPVRQWWSKKASRQTRKGETRGLLPERAHHRSVCRGVDRGRKVFMPQGLIAVTKNHNNIHFLDFWILCFLLFVQYDEIDATSIHPLTAGVCCGSN